MTCAWSSAATAAAAVVAVAVAAVASASSLSEPREAANPPSRSSRRWRGELVSFGLCVAGNGIAARVVGVVAGDVMVIVSALVAGVSVPLGCLWLARKVKGLAEARGAAARSSGINVTTSILWMYSVIKPISSLRRICAQWFYRLASSLRSEYLQKSMFEMASSLGKFYKEWRAKVTEAEEASLSISVQERKAYIKQPASKCPHTHKETNLSLGVFSS